MHGHAPDGQGILASQVAEAVKAAVATGVCIPVFCLQSSFAQQLINRPFRIRFGHRGMGASDGKGAIELDLDIMRVLLQSGGISGGFYALEFSGFRRRFRSFLLLLHLLLRPSY